jgi:type I site-specific restriction endonuclease
MGSFDVTAVESLDYDFTGFPQDKDNSKNCTGKGTIPEPTQKHLKDYAEAMKNLYAVDTTEELTEKVAAQKAEGGEDPAAQQKTIEKIAALTSALCQNSPKKAELMQLPPRIRTAFLKWIYQELANPEVSSAGSRESRPTGATSTTS